MFVIPAVKNMHVIGGVMKFNAFILLMSQATKYLKPRLFAGRIESGWPGPTRDIWKPPDPTRPNPRDSNIFWPDPA